MPPSLPDTRPTLVAALASALPGDRVRAHDLIARAYRDPVARLLAVRWKFGREDAEDTTHEFFSEAIEKGWFARYDAQLGRFRPFLRRCLDDFVRSALRDAGRLKRGGGTTHADLETSHDDALGVAPEAEGQFEREWRRSVLGIACERLRAECVANGKDIAWTLFVRYDLTDAPDDARPTYASLAVELDQPVTQVTNHLAWARRRMREHVLVTVRELTGDESEYRDEVRALLGFDPT